MANDKPKDIVENLLEKLGFKRALSKLGRGRKVFPKLKVAYARYGFIREEQIQAFENKLAKEKAKVGYRKTLLFSRLENYDRDVPPIEVLQKIEEAKAVGCFDYFEIAFVEEVKKDPIVFGRIEGCRDRFFIAQWDTDVSIEQIIMASEGK
jgi:hypothetical protein